MMLYYSQNKIIIYAKTKQNKEQRESIRKERQGLKFQWDGDDENDDDNDNLIWKLLIFNSYQLLINDNLYSKI